MNKKSIIDKILKLRAIAEHNSSDEIQATIFAAKVAELLAAHDLSIADLVEEQEGVTEFMWNTMYADPWRRAMWSQVCALYFCDLIKDHWWDTESRVNRRGIRIIGRPEHIFVAREMCEYLEKTIMRLATDYARTHPDSLYHQRRVHLSFERGCGERMAARLAELKLDREAGEKKKTASGNPGNLPALYDSESLAVREYKDKMEGLTRRRRRRSKMDHEASLAGILAADSIKLDPQLQRELDPENPDGVDDPGEA